MYTLYRFRWQIELILKVMKVCSFKILLISILVLYKNTLKNINNAVYFADTPNSIKNDNYVAFSYSQNNS